MLYTYRYAHYRNVSFHIHIYIYDIYVCVCVCVCMYLIVATCYNLFAKEQTPRSYFEEHTGAGRQWPVTSIGHPSCTNGLWAELAVTQATGDLVQWRHLPPC